MAGALLFGANGGHALLCLAEYLAGLIQNVAIEHAGEHFGKKGENVEFHR